MTSFTYYFDGLSFVSSLNYFWIVRLLFAVELVPLMYFILSIDMNGAYILQSLLMDRLFHRPKFQPLKAHQHKSDTNTNWHQNLMPTIPQHPMLIACLLFNYGSPAWFFNSKSNITRVQTTENSAHRTIIGCLAITNTQHFLSKTEIFQVQSCINMICTPSYETALDLSHLNHAVTNHQSPKLKTVSHFSLSLLTGPPHPK